MESAGSRLKIIRQEKGINLEDASRKTKIHINVLRALEGDSITNLSPVYLKGFLKIYCQFLGVDPAEFAQDHHKTQAARAEAAGKESVLPKPVSLFKTASVKLRYFQPSKKAGRFFIIFAVSAILFLGLYNLGKGIVSKRHSKLISTKVKPHITAPAKTGVKKTPVPRKAKTTVAQTLPKSTQSSSVKPEVSGIRLNIRARSNCWLSVEVDGKVVFQRVLEKGRSESWQAKDKIILSLGNAAGVELEVNGKLFSNLGRRNQAKKNIVITREGLDVGR